MSVIITAVAVLLVVVGVFMVVQGDAKRSYAKEFGWATTVFGIGIFLFVFGNALLTALGLVGIVGAAVLYYNIYKKKQTKSIGR